MSLISDALKAAQRERLQRRTERPSTSFTDTILPYSRQESRLPRWFLPVGFGSAVSASGGTGVLIHGRPSSARQKAAARSRSAASKAPATVATPAFSETQSAQPRAPGSPAVSIPAATRPAGTVA